MSQVKEKPVLLLVDGHSLAFRSFYAYTKGSEGGLATKDGTPTSVTYGFLKSLLDHCKNLSPQGITIAFDTPEPTFRHKTDSNYKANRDVAPDIFFQDLKQLQTILKDNLNIPLCMAPGFEADDILGALANIATKEGWKVRILSGDRDLFQLVDDQKDIAVMYMGGGPYSKSSGPVVLDEAGVKDKLGVFPKKVVDLKALTGDSSDNIPGVKGVGPKTAILLLEENNDLDGVYSALADLEKEGDKSSKGVIKGALKNKLKNDKESAYLSRFLAEILLEIPSLEEPRLELEAVDSKGLISSLELLELNSLVRQVPSFVATFSKGGFRKNVECVDNERKYSKKNSIQKVSEAKSLELNSLNLPQINPTVITDHSDLKKLVAKLMSFHDPTEPVAIDTETTNLNPFKAELVGIGFCWGDSLSELAYIPIGHQLNESIFEKQDGAQISLDIIIRELSPWISNKEFPKVLQNAKYDRLIFLRHGIDLDGVVMDTLLADYLLDANAKHGLNAIAKREFGMTLQNFNDLVEKGKTFSNVSIPDASIYCGMDVYITRLLSKRLRDKLLKMGAELLDLLENVEQPLEKVLALMEVTGIRVDIPYLQKLSLELTENLQQLEIDARKEAGCDFNLASPKQLSELLFENLKLDRKKSRRLKTGWSTDANVLEKLQSDHPVIPLLIEHRILSKLLSTYVDTLPQLVEFETGRVHTDFNQAVTSTGRLSSSNPNLQNIPIRTEFSRRIRKAFLPKENWQLLSADYSQIELRILAHLSREEILQQAYQNGEDVHALTAKVLLDKQDVNSDERRLGKTINFGVIYGMGVQRFARSTGVSQIEAKDFLDRYRKRYKKVFEFLELQERLALTRGFVETILGRRRIFNFDKNGLGRLLGKDPYEIDLNMARRAGLEAQQLRAAANAPIQGSSADIIKVAMVQLQKRIKEESLPARLLLQVHDELVLEVDPIAIEHIRKVVVEVMEGVIALSVPLLVEVGVGINWMEAK